MANQTFDQVMSIADRLTYFQMQMLWGIQSGDLTKAEIIKSTNNRLWAVLESLAMERNRGVANAYGVGVPECNVTRLAPGLTQVVTGSPALLFGIANADGLTNGSAITVLDNATTIASFPATTLSTSQTFDFKGAKFNTNLTISVVVAAGTNLLVFWRLQ